MPTRQILAREAALLEALPGRPFVRALAAGDVPRPALVRWLQEDLWFVRLLRRPVGLLLADAPDERAADVVAGAFPALDGEIRRFEAELARLGAAPAPAPCALVARFDRLLRDAAAAGFATGIAAYWATEHAYLHAWSAVRGDGPARGPYAAWIENWTSPGFAAFVAGLGRLADEHADPAAALPLAHEVLALEVELWDHCWAAVG
ncbi:MAG: hypothetical protein R3C15_13755 [Thermoleophilia bacterium]